MESSASARAKNARAILDRVRSKTGIKSGFFSSYKNSDMGGVIGGRRKAKLSPEDAKAYKQTLKKRRSRAHTKTKAPGAKRTGKRRCRKGYRCRKALTAEEKKARFQRVKNRVKTHLSRQRKRTLTDESTICMKLKDFFHSLRQFGFK